MRTAVALILVLGSLASAQAQLHTRAIAGQNVSYGPRAHCVAPTGDLNGDGLPDLVASSCQTAIGQEGVALVSGKTGTVFRFTTTNANNGALPAVQSVAGLGDLDGDGFTEYAAGLPYVGTPSVSWCGIVMVFSGATGALIRTISGTATNDMFGWSITAIGDQDGDGVSDLVIGAPQGQPLTIWDSGIGYVRVVSGATGATIRTLAGFGFADLLGASVARLGDVNGDGVEDFVAGAPEQTLVTDNSGIGFPLSGGYVTAYSGATGAVLYTVGLTSILGPSAGFSGFGTTMAAAGDVNGDGIGDFAANAPLRSIAFVLSGATGSVISTLNPGPLSDWTISVGGGGDLNGDGIPDVILGVPDYSNFAAGPSAFGVGRVLVFSGTGGLLATLDGSFASGHAGVGVAVVGDQNGDGFAEVAICSEQAAGFWNGTLRIAGLAVADRYGGAQPLALGWTHAFGSIGVVTLSGAPAGAAGVLVSSSAPASTTIGGLPVLVDLTPGQFSALGFAFSASGSIAGAVDLRHPGLAGFTAYLQGAALPLVSNGLSLSFAP